MSLMLKLGAGHASQPCGALYFQALTFKEFPDNQSEESSAK
jgi:hypothetical protein